ncbi:MAG: hypothetical protein EOO41_01445, partial [Methanobacteriota archaeon]
MEDIAHRALTQLLSKLDLHLARAADAAPLLPHAVRFVLRTGYGVPLAARLIQLVTSDVLSGSDAPAPAVPEQAPVDNALTLLASLRTVRAASDGEAQAAAAAIEHAVGVVTALQQLRTAAADSHTARDPRSESGTGSDGNDASSAHVHAGVEQHARSPASDALSAFASRDTGAGTLASSGEDARSSSLAVGVLSALHTASARWKWDVEALYGRWSPDASRLATAITDHGVSAADVETLAFVEATCLRTLARVVQAPPAAHEGGANDTQAACRAACRMAQHVQTVMAAEYPLVALHRRADLLTFLIGLLHVATDSGNVHVALESGTSLGVRTMLPELGACVAHAVAALHTLLAPSADVETQPAAQTSSGGAAAAALHCALLLAATRHMVCAATEALSVSSGDAGPELVALLLTLRPQHSWLATLAAQLPRCTSSEPGDAACELQETLHSSPLIPVVHYAAQLFVLAFARFLQSARRHVPNEAYHRSAARTPPSTLTRALQGLLTSYWSVFSLLPPAAFLSEAQQAATFARVCSDSGCPPAHWYTRGPLVGDTLVAAALHHSAWLYTPPALNQWLVSTLSGPLRQQLPAHTVDALQTRLLRLSPVVGQSFLCALHVHSMGVGGRFVAAQARHALATACPHVSMGAAGCSNLEAVLTHTLLQPRDAQQLAQAPPARSLALFWKAAAALLAQRGVLPQAQAPAALLASALEWALLLDASMVEAVTGVDVGAHAAGLQQRDDAGQYTLALEVLVLTIVVTHALPLAAELVAVGDDCLRTLLALLVSQQERLRLGSVRAVDGVLHAAKA